MRSGRADLAGCVVCAAAGRCLCPALSSVKRVGPDSLHPGLMGSPGGCPGSLAGCDPDDDLTALADRMDAAVRAATEARVGAVWARPPAETPAKAKSAVQRGGPRGARTHNPRIKSPLLCQLS